MTLSVTQLSFGEGILTSYGGCTVAVPFYIRLLTAADSETVYTLYQQVIAAIDPVHLRPVDRDFFIAHSGEQGYTLGVFIKPDETLIAYGVLALEETALADLGLDVGLTVQQWTQAVKLDGVGVLAPWRGNGLQQRLLAGRIMIANALQRPHLLATVAPANTASCHNALRFGLHIKALKNKYEGLLRYVLHRDQRQSVQFAVTDSQRIALTDLVAQQQVLANGAWGYHLERDANQQHYWIHYGHPLFAEIC